MTRPIRIEFCGALYHVTSRGDRREAIYEDDADRSRFLEVLAQVVADANWVCHAYCLMGNHYHLVIETPDKNLSKGMRQLNRVYTQESAGERGVRSSIDASRLIASGGVRSSIDAAHMVACGDATLLGLTPFFFHSFLYANNNPYKFTDPDGRAAFVIPAIPVIVVVAAVAAVYIQTLPEDQKQAAVSSIERGIINVYNEIRGEDGAEDTDASAGTDEKPRFVGQPNGEVVDTETTPRGSYDQPDGGRTDILQDEDHGSGQSHTHDPITNTNPSTGETFQNGRTREGRRVSEDDVNNIQSGAAPRSKPTGRGR